MAREDPEAFLRVMAAQLGTARRGRPLPGVPFSREAVANAFVMLGLLPERRAEEILAEYQPRLEAEGFRLGILTGELSVRPGAHGFQDARTADQGNLAQIPLAVAAGPAHIPLGGVDLSVTWVTLIPGGLRLRYCARMRDNGRMSETLGEQIQSGLSVTDNTGRRYRAVPGSGRGTGVSGRRGDQAPRWHGEILAEPEPRTPEPDAAGAIHWLEFATNSGPPARVVVPAPASVATGTADPPWPTPAECYLAVLASVTSMSLGADGGMVELDTAQIVAAVADALLSVGALPPDSALLSEGATTDGGHRGWREPLVHLWGAHARRRACDGEPDQAGLAARLPLRQATAVIESITAHDDLVSIQLYGHPWVTGEYWPMIAPCFQVQAVDDRGAHHQGVRGGGGGEPEGNYEFWFWPPVAPAARKLRVIVSTLWEAGWAEIEIPGRSA